MHIVYSHHAKQRMRQRAVTELEVAHIMRHHKYLIKSHGDTRIVVGELNSRTIHVVFVHKEKYINIVTVR